MASPLWMGEIRHEETAGPVCQRLEKDGYTILDHAVYKVFDYRSLEYKLTAVRQACI